MSEETVIRIPKTTFNPGYLPYLEEERRYLLFYGGAASGKSMFAVQRYIYRMLSQKGRNLLVVRAVARSHRDSTFALFRQVMEKWGVSRFFKIQEGEMRIRCEVNGNEAIFKGLDDPEKLKSITFASGELTDIWIEEASEIEEAAFSQLDIRLRGRGKSKQLVMTFNPIDANHWLKRRFFERKNPRAAIVHTTYKDNRFLADEDRAVLEGFRESDPYYYQVYCLGEWGVYGNTVFDAAKVNERIAQIRGEDVRCGRFLEPDGRFAESGDGCIRIYKEPEEHVPYVIGGDTAGDGSDYFVGQVLDNRTGEQCAVLRGQMDEDEYARQIDRLGRYYNNALVAIEVNYSSYPIRELQRLGYPRQYFRETVDRITNVPTYRYGFRTDAQTRPLILAGLIRVVRERVELFHDMDTLSEMLTFVRNSRGRPEAKSGAHDDCIMAAAIAHEIRPQQQYREIIGAEEPEDGIEEFITYGG